jgi:hypothetical protein
LEEILNQRLLCLLGVLSGFLGGGLSIQRRLFDSSSLILSPLLDGFLLSPLGGSFLSGSNLCGFLLSLLLGLLLSSLGGGFLLSLLLGLLLSGCFLSGGFLSGLLLVRRQFLLALFHLVLKSVNVYEDLAALRSFELLLL